MSWRDERTTIRQGSLVSLVLTGSLIVTMTTLCTGVIVSAIYGSAPQALVFALLVLVVLRLAVSLFETANRYLRRRARRRRMQGL